VKLLFFFCLACIRGNVTLSYYTFLKTLVNVSRKDAGEGFHKFIQWSHTLLREGHDVFTVSVFINSVITTVWHNYFYARPLAF
jgi:hypothetical protein